MDGIKSRSLEKIQHKMATLDKDSLRYQTLESVKNFKTSWIELGRNLYAVWKDKFYKDWGYVSFDSYTAKEIGIRKATAIKLLRSYYFLEKEEPEYLKKDYSDPRDMASLPTYEAIDVLRLAKNKKTLDEEDYSGLKKSVFEKGKDFREVKKDLFGLIRQRQEIEPQAAWEKKKESQVKRLIGVLKSLKNEAEVSRTLPQNIIKDINNLISKLQDQMS